MAEDSVIYKVRSMPMQLLSKMSLAAGSSPSKKKRRHQQLRGQGTPPASPYNSSGSESSPGNSPYIPHRRRTYQTPPGHCSAVVDTDASKGISEPDGFSLSKAQPKLQKWTGSSRGSGDRYSVYNPKNVQNLLDWLNRPGTKELLDPMAGEDGPLHCVVCQPRPDKEKVNLLVTFLTYSDVDINYPGKDGMTPLHYAVQANDLASVQALLAFGADVNVVNTRQHTVLDVATLLWLAHERKTKISHRTNKLETVHEGKLRISLKILPNVSMSPAPSPLLQKANPRFVTRQGSASSWEYVSEENGSSSSSEGDTAREGAAKQPRESLDDSRELTSTMEPIKATEMKDEVVDEASTRHLDTASSDQEVVKCISSILELLYSVHAQSGKSLLRKFNHKMPLISSFSESEEFQSSIDAASAVANPFLESSDFGKSIKIEDFMEGRTVFSLYEELEFNINQCLESQSSLSTSPDYAIALAMQQRELFQFRKTAKVGIDFEVSGGSRLLFLDGGGIKGLVQIEVLRLLEEVTGRKVTQLFDWIIGSSIGAIIALGLVYANKSLKELQQLMFKLKDEVFANPRGGFAFNTKAMEKMIMEEFGPDMLMCDVKKPKVLIAAVNKTYAPPKLHFFNNCFNDNFSRTPVWKVARYTSAAPIFFKEFEGYVDGGVLANNPCDYGLTAIQKFHWERNVNLPISMVVSVGTGIYPPEELGRIDAQEFLFFGKHWFSFSDNVKSRTQNLLSLLTNALVESEIVAKNCSVRCMEQNIPYYRFSPQLSHVIAAGETDNEKLLEMMWQTRVQTPQQGLRDLVTLFQLVADASKKTRYRHSRIHDL